MNSYTQEACDKNYSKKTKDLLETLNQEISEREKYNIYKSILKQDENCADAYYGIGKYFFYLNILNEDNFDKSAKYLLKSIRLCKNINEDAYYLLGSIYFGKKEYSRALGYYKQALYLLEDKSSNHYFVLNNLIEKSSFRMSFYQDEVKVNYIPFINADYDEFSIGISPDNSIFMFSSNEEKNHIGNEFYLRKYSKLNYYSKSSNYTSFKESSLIGPFNIDTNESYLGTTYTLDNQIMYISICKTNEDSVFGCNIYQANKKTFGWGDYKALSENININRLQIHPSVTSDGRKIFFASFNPKTKSYDLFQSEKGEDGVWSLAKPLEEINTKGHEISPFIHPNNTDFYFSSMPDSSVNYRYENAGGLDIYHATFDSLGTLKNSVNHLKYPINTKYNDFGMVVSTGGKSAYKSSNTIENSGGFNIYKFNTYKEIFTKPIYIVKGSCNFKDNNTKVVLKNINNNDVLPLEINPKNGSFSHLINDIKDDYIIKLSTKGYYFHARSITPRDTNYNNVIDVNFDVKKIQNKIEYPLYNVVFMNGTHKINKSSYYVLNEFASFIKSNPKYKVKLYVYKSRELTDATSSLIVDERVDALTSFFKRKGVASQIDIKGFITNSPHQTKNINYQLGDFSIEYLISQ